MKQFILILSIFLSSDLYAQMDRQQGIDLDSWNFCGGPYQHQAMQIALNQKVRDYDNPIWNYMKCLKREGQSYYVEYVYVGGLSTEPFDEAYFKINGFTGEVTLRCIVRDRTNPVDYNQRSCREFRRRF